MIIKSYAKRSKDPEVFALKFVGLRHQTKIEKKYHPSHGKRKTAFSHISSFYRLFLVEIRESFTGKTPNTFYAKLFCDFGFLVFQMLKRCNVWLTMRAHSRTVARALSWFEIYKKIFQRHQIIMKYLIEYSEIIHKKRIIIHEKNRNLENKWVPERGVNCFVD